MNLFLRKLFLLSYLYVIFLAGFQVKANNENTCTTPATQPTNLNIAYSTSNNAWMNFTATPADEYLVLVSTSATLTVLPVNSTIYTVGDVLGNAKVAGASSATSYGIYYLNESTTYYIFVFSLNKCVGSPLYNTNSPLTATVTTSALPTNLPLAQPTGLQFNTITGNSISGSFNPSNSGNYNYIVVYSTSSVLTATPTANYSVGDKLGNGYIASVGTATTFSVSSLNLGTTYYFFVFAYTVPPSCNCGNIYRVTAPLTAGVSTLSNCIVPNNQVSTLNFGTVTTTSVSGTFSAATADEYLLLYSTSATLSGLPVNGTTYTAGASLGNAIVASIGTATNFTISGLTPSTTYYVSIFTLNSFNCANGPVYNTNPKNGFIATNSNSLNYYFGTFHSHSEYSDGTALPSADYVYAKASNCMDFLGISEHNHVAAGMSLSNWPLGRSQAASATTSTFVAMYGMEWGVISGGGHVIVYGVDTLLGWDAGQYQTYVAKSDYIGTSGLFSTINSIGGNAFATLAHPNNSDFSNIMTTYNQAADNAIVGTAVESGPAFSTNTTYSDPASSMADLPYYRNMLARGYHLGPTMDHDNHNLTHGRTTSSRTVVLAPSLSEANILSAMRQMRFYASQDCSARVTFKINNNEMGSSVTASGAPTITVTATTSNPITSIKIYSGVPGSGTNATTLTSTTSGSITYTHTALANLAEQYYYIDITESDGKRIVTSPIWYARNNTP